MQTEQQVTYNVSPFWVCLRRPQRLGMLRHIQDVGVQFRSHGELSVEKRGGQRQREKDGCKVCQVQRESEYERRSRRAESGVWRGERGVGGGKKREDDKWDSRLRDTTLVLLLISLSTANSEKDAGIIYWLGERKKGKSCESLARNFRNI